MKRFLVAFLMLGLALSGCRSSEPAASAASSAAAGSLDSRLEAYLTHVIKDPKTLEQQKAIYASQGVMFEPFILLVYTRAVEFDTTPDNSMALAQLGEYLEEKRPSLSPTLLQQMEEFYSTKSNQTIMRGMFLTTVRGILDPR